MRKHIESIIAEAKAEVGIITAHEIIESRQKALIQEKFDLELEEAQAIKDFEIRMRRIAKRRIELEAEYDILSKSEDQARIVTVPQSKSLVIGAQLQHSDKIKIEDCIKRIFDNAGRPIRIGQILEELSRYGFQWRNYGTAYAYLKSTGLLDSTGKQGYYQMQRSK